MQVLGQKTLYFTLKIEIGKNFTLKIEIGKKYINRKVKGVHKTIIVKFDKIWLNMFRTARYTKFRSKNAVFHLKNLNRKKN